MATFGELQSSVSSRILDGSNTAVSASNVAASINNSIRYWKYKRFWFNQVSDTVTMTLNDATIPLTGDFLVPLYDDGGFVLEDNGIRYPLEKISDAQYNRIFTDDCIGLPNCYARLGQSYEVYPIPDSAYVMRREYLKEYADLVNSSDTNDFTNYADRLILLWTCADVSAEYRRDLEMENYFRNAARDEYMTLTMMTNKSNGSGKLTLNTYL